MLIIADSRMPAPARRRLETLGEVLWMPPQKRVYQSIAAHPDIFFCQTPEGFIVAPNAPVEITAKLIQSGATIVVGEKNVGEKHPDTVPYNAVFTASLFIHNTKLSDETLLRHAIGKKRIHTTQGYTRCNLLPLSDTAFLCSDRNIEQNLVRHGADVLFVRPEEILLPGVRHGFIGGCCGVFGKTVVVVGALSKHSQGGEIEKFLEKYGMEIIELYDGEMWDGGGMLFA
ncbi:MAG: hypothetical protein FWG84_03670 [Bacteroidales bacterium]|nr:hypothetical protein [Bacteroidales bacterium]